MPETILAAQSDADQPDQPGQPDARTPSTNDGRARHAFQLTDGALDALQRVIDEAAALHDRAVALAMRVRDFQ